MLQGYGVGAFQDDPRHDPRAEFVDARRAGSEDEMRQVRQAARAILSRAARRRAGFCEGLLSTLFSHLHGNASSRANVSVTSIGASVRLGNLAKKFLIISAY
jgi:hypothetical protein